MTSPAVDTGIVAFIEARLNEREKRARQNMNWNTKTGVRQKAEVAKDRAILAYHHPFAVARDHPGHCDADNEVYPCQTVRLLAAIDAGHEAYDPSWKPVAT